MKNKKLLFILIPATLLLWGYIVYKIIITASGNEPVNKTIPNQIIFENNDIAIDTFSIYPNYRDPFMGEMAKKPIIKDNNQPKKPILITAWPTIVYSGAIKNQTSNKQLAIIQINGQSNIMKVGEKIGDIELLIIFPDSIEVKMGKEKRFVRK